MAVNTLNLEPIRQRLFDLRVRGLGEWYPMYAAKRELTKEQICDDGDDMVKEIQRLRLENDRLRVENQVVREAIEYRIEHEKKQTGNTSKYRVKLLEWVLSLKTGPVSP